MWERWRKTAAALFPLVTRCQLSTFDASDLITRNVVTLKRNAREHVRSFVLRVEDSYIHERCVDVVGALSVDGDEKG